jgi:uncharacterized protein (TIGR02996 family)
VSQEPADLPDIVAPRRFEYADDRSYKFWTIALNGLRLTTRFGRIGHQGQTREIRFDSAQDAKRNYLQRIRRKTRDGYEERIPEKKNALTSRDDWISLAGHEPFLQTILAEPDEPAPYAVYADWLTEQQDPRGEFIRLQMSLEDPALPLYRRTKLENAAKLIQVRHAREWLGSLVPWLMNAGPLSYPYQFWRGQLASIACLRLSFRFAHELKQSPHCRLLRQLSIGGTETLRESIRLGDQHYEADRDYGIEPLLGGDFGNLRELRIGTLPETLVGGTVANKTRLVEWMAAMPRLERLWVRGDFDFRSLLQLPLDHLIELHIEMDRSQVAWLARSGLLPRLKILGMMNPLTEEVIDALIEIPGFDQLTQFACHEISSVSESAIERLRGTGVVLDVTNFPG